MLENIVSLIKTRNWKVDCFLLSFNKWLHLIVNSVDLAKSGTNFIQEIISKPNLWPGYDVCLDKEVKYMYIF